MSKYYGNIGFVIPTKTGTDVWTPKITEKPYKGDLLKVSARYDRGSKINDDISISNTLSIIADQFVQDNIGYIKYITWMNNKWTVESFEFAYPRIILYIGGLYNGK